MFDLTGKAALVTGASGGIGEAIARALHAQGAAVAISGTRAAVLDALAGSLGERVHPLPCDLSKPQEVEKLVPAAEAALGRLDILVNNAGFVDFIGLADMPLATFDRTFMHYVRAPFLLSQGVIPFMRHAGAGWIVNISSQDALPPIRPFPPYEKDRGYGAYAAAKAALNRLTQGMAAELVGENIAVNAVGPSTAIRTPGADSIIPQEYPTEDVAYLAETVLAMSHLPAAERTGLIGYSMHFPWHYDIPVRSLDGKSALPRKEPPAWSHTAISPSGVY